MPGATSLHSTCPKSVFILQSQLRCLFLQEVLPHSKLGQIPTSEFISTPALPTLGRHCLEMGLSPHWTVSPQRGLPQSPNGSQHHPAQGRGSRNACGISEHVWILITYILPFLCPASPFIHWQMFIEQLLYTKLCQMNSTGHQTSPHSQGAQSLVGEAIWKPM